MHFVRHQRRAQALRIVAAVNLVLGVGGVVALAVRQPAPISVGALPGGAVLHQVVRPAQPIPASIAIPEIGVTSALQPLDIGADGVLAVPVDYAVAGWWASGPKPGADGAAVIVGHVDSKKGPAVFYRLRQLHVGSRIEVRRLDNSTITFVVDALRQYSKSSIPANVVYGPTPTPSLRLITCGGSFDKKAKSYRDNLVVFAHQELDSKAVAV